jgi:predicted phage-related endonuclease
VSYENICVSTDDRARWLAERRKGIGSTVAPMLLGVHRWGSLLGEYLDKRGEGPPDEQTERMLYGREKQDVILAAIGRRLGIRTKPSEDLIRSNERPWQLSTLDGWAWPEVYPKVQIAPAEVKAVMSPALVPGWEEGVPEYVIPQVQWHLSTLGESYERELVCAELCGAPPVYQWVERDEEMIAELEAKGAEFWDRIQRGDPPPPDGSDDCGKAVEAAAKWREGTTQALTIEHVVMSERIAEISKLRAALKREGDQLKQTIRTAMGGAETGVLPGDAGRWNTQRTSKPAYIKVVPLDGSIGLMHVAAKLEGMEVRVSDVDGSESSHIRKGK